MGQFEAVPSSPGVPGHHWLEVLGPRVGNPQAGLSSWLRDLIKGDNRWVTVGDNGSIFSSLDGKTWNAACVSDRDEVRAVAWTGSHYVAVGRIGQAYISEDGLTWSPVTTEVTSDLKAIIWAGDRLIAAGDNGTVITSPDGVTWTSASSPLPNTVSCNCLEWNGSRVLCGADKVYYSDDKGDSWSASVTSLQEPIIDIEWSGSSWFAVSSEYWLSSADGDNWTETAFIYGVTPTSLLIDEGDLIVGCTISGEYGTNGDFMVSEDNGSTWRNLNYPFRYAPLAIAKSGNVRLAVGKEGVTIRSTDGKQWESRLLSGKGHWINQVNAVASGANRRDLPNAAYLVSSLVQDFSSEIKVPTASSSKIRRVAWNGSKFLAVGRNSVFASLDGLLWEDHTPDIFQFLPEDICWTGSKWIIVASFGKVFTSTDGITWLQGQLPFSAPSAIIAAGPRIVVIGGGVASSTDGITWESATPDIVGGKDITWHDGRYLLVGGSGLAATSTDGITWTQIPPITGNSLTTVAWHAGRFWAVGSPWGGPVISTTDGSSWSETNARIGFDCSLLSLGQNLLAFSGPAEWAHSQNGLTWKQSDLNGGNFRTAAWNGRTYALFGNGGRLFLSADGRHWFEQPRLPEYSVQSDAIAYQNGFIAVGTAGILRSSDAFTWEKVDPPSDVSSNLLNLATSGTQWVAVGQQGAILSSSDTDNWISVDSGTAWTLQDVIWAGDRFIASGSGGVVLSSQDGVNWVSIPSNRTDSIRNLVWNGTTLFAIASNRYVISTNDFLTWNVSDLGENASQTVCTWANDKLVGMMTSGPQTYWISSSDGIVWEEYRPLGFWERYDDLLWDGGQFLAVGWYQTRRSGASGGGFEKWSSYNGWQNVDFGAINPTSGKPYGFEYAMYSKSTNENHRESLTIMANGKTLSFSTPLIAPSDITYTIESSSSLLHGSWLTVATKYPDENWDYDYDTLGYSASGGKQYFQLDVDNDSAVKQFYRFRLHRNP